jgi:hypothetical protein
MLLLLLMLPLAPSVCAGASVEKERVLYDSCVSFSLLFLLLFLFFLALPWGSFHLTGTNQ